MAQTEKIFADGLFCKTREASFGKVLKLSFDVKRFTEFLNEHADDKGFVRVDLLNKREPTDQSSHYGVLDTYKQKESGDEQPTRQAVPVKKVTAPVKPIKSSKPQVDDDPFGNSGF